MEQKEINKEGITEVQDGLNGKILTKLSDCSFCKVKNSKFINVGHQDVNFICSNCGFISSFGKEKLIHDRWVFHFSPTEK